MRLSFSFTRKLLIWCLCNWWTLAKSSWLSRNILFGEAGWTRWLWWVNHSGGLTSIQNTICWCYQSGIFLFIPISIPQFSFLTLNLAPPWWIQQSDSLSVQSRHYVSDTVLSLLQQPCILKAYKKVYFHCVSMLGLCARVVKHIQVQQVICQLCHPVETRKKTWWLWNNGTVLDLRPTL